MKEKYLQAFIDAIPCLKEVLKDDFTITVIDAKTKKVIANENGHKIISRFTIGTEATDPSKVIENVIKNKKQLSSVVPPNTYEIPAKGIITPVLDEQGDVVAVVMLVKNMELETTIEEVASSVFSSMFQLNGGIEEIGASSQQLSEFIGETLNFSEQTKNKISEIDSIIEVIKNISSQSKLLAMNATIEAARVGDVGRGFSVVAHEMGKLSNMSKESAERVAKSLLDMKSAIEMITQQIGKTSQSCESQTAATEEIVAMAQGIVGDTKKLSDISKIQSYVEAYNKS